MLTLIKGFYTGACLIIAIGAQNAFIIRQGLLGQHLLLTALLSASLDALLIGMGVLGFGEIIGQFPLFITLAKYFAIAFLLFYGMNAFRSAWRNETKMELALAEGNIASVQKTVMMLVAISLLNPHAYLDTVVLLGSIASPFPFDEKLLFATGAILSSFVWFFSLTYGATLLGPLFQKRSAWRLIDTLVGVTMWGIAFALLISSL